MILPNMIETNLQSRQKGLYESYYFRGNDTNGCLSFWLKHNFLILKGKNQVIVECTLITFEKTHNVIKSWNVKESIGIDKFLILKEKANNSWDSFSYQFKNNSFFKITSDQLTGNVITEESNASWNFNIHGSGETYYHFSKEKYYKLAFPKKKILTRDTCVLFTGIIENPDLSLSDTFKGINGHNWGTEHAYKYQYANCNQFNEKDAYFDGFSAKINLLGFIRSPYLSGCSLKVNNTWYHFNEVIKSYQHKVILLNEKSWDVTFKNKTHLLHVQISDLKNDWVHLNYKHPSGKFSQVNNTKFATGKLQLIEKVTLKKVEVLTSSLFELESLIPNLHE